MRTETETVPRPPGLRPFKLVYLPSQPLFKLPTDVKDRIWTMLMDETCTTKYIGFSKTGLTNYSMVCREWEEFFRPYLWGRLTLRQSCLNDFGQIAQRSNRLEGCVKHLHLQIELSKFYCYYCPMVYTALWHDEKTVRESITSLFEIISGWRKDAWRKDARQRVVRQKDGPDDHGRNAVLETDDSDGLRLEISLYSPSDSKHCLGTDFHLGPGLFESEAERLVRASRQDPRHGWNAPGHQSRDVDYISTWLHRPLSDEHVDLFPQGLPTVDAVTSFLIRRQTRRRFPYKSLQRILDSLASLESIRIETWRDFASFVRRKGPSDLAGTLQHEADSLYYALCKSCPPGTTSVTIFEDFDEADVRQYLKELPWDELHADKLPGDNSARRRYELVRTPTPVISIALAHLSLRLEKLHASFMVEAWDFFDACQGDCRWDNLMSLSLTSKLLTVRRPDSEGMGAIKSLLLRAGQAALRMPKLKSLAIWNGARDCACAFKYEVQNGTSQISWRGTWVYLLNPDGEGEYELAWQKVAAQHTNHGLNIPRAGWIHERSIRSHADAIVALDLCEVVDPVSLEQIRRESQITFADGPASLNGDLKSELSD